MSAAAHGHHDLGFFKKYMFSTDHKVIGMQYLITGIIMAFLGGYLAVKFRSQLAFPELALLSGSEYNSSVTMHGLIMVFWVAMPILVAAFGNFLIPTMIGCDDMAYPTLNMISYWLFLVSAFVAIASLLIGGYGGAWTLYPPLSANMAEASGGGAYVIGKVPGLFSGGSLIITAVALEIIAFLIGGLNFLVTTINMRAPGMSIWDLPFVVWMIDLAVVVFMFSVGPLVAGAIMLLFDRTLGTGFFDPNRGGDPILFQHLFWFFGHPEVYVVLFPSMGFVGEAITTFSRKPLFGFKKVIWAAIVASILSFIVWAHHQFIAGIDPHAAVFFTIFTVLISVPFAAMMFSFIATLWKGSIELTSAMLWALGFIITFLFGGVTGIYLGTLTSDVVFHDTYFVVAHFHYTFVPITIFGGMTAIYFWFPKFVGKNFSEFWGKVHFWISFISFNAIFLPMFIPGTAGQHRRIAGYTEATFPAMAVEPYATIRIISTVAFWVLFIAQVIWIIHMIVKFYTGEKAVKNPWKANTLEWTCDSPPPHGNFATYPTVYRGPYEYSVPSRDSDYWPQDEKG